MRCLWDLVPCAPAWGLAVEEALLESVMRTGEPIVRAWVNDAAVVIGRSQCAHAEVDLEAAQIHGVPIIRRISGGGAVLHYPGNLNLSVFTRVGPASGVQAVFRRFGGQLAEALSEPGRVLRSVGNGIYADARKVGGAAQARRKAALLYHTTLMLEPTRLPMERLLRALQPGYATATVASIPREMTDLSTFLGHPVCPQTIAEAALSAMVRAAGADMEAVGCLTVEEHSRAHALRQQKYEEASWNLSR